MIFCGSVTLTKLQLILRKRTAVKIIQEIHIDFSK